MDTILLRTLSRKSIFQEGKFKGLSVQDVLNLQKKRYLRYCYYCFSMISFLPDILNEIGITENVRISKPGTDKEMFEYVNKLAIMSTGSFSRLKTLCHLKKEKKQTLIQKNISRDKFITKGYLQAKNHGKL